MTADQRLEQLEPLVAENIAVLDRHTIQLTRLNNAVSRLNDIAVQQSDNISFLLEENIKTNERLNQLDKNVAELKTDVAELKQGQGRVEDKLDLILSKLN
ncbi:MAG: hypothetical protein ACRYFX_03105 [Janthinobacterium lividum]